MVRSSYTGAIHWNPTRGTLCHRSRLFKRSFITFLPEKKLDGKCICPRSSRNNSRVLRLFNIVENKPSIHIGFGIKNPLNTETLLVTPWCARVL